MSCSAFLPPCLHITGGCVCFPTTSSLGDAAGLILDTGLQMRVPGVLVCLGKKDILFLHEAVLVTELFYT